MVPKRRRNGNSHETYPQYFIKTMNAGIYQSGEQLDLVHRAVRTGKYTDVLIVDTSKPDTVARTFLVGFQTWIMCGSPELAARERAKQVHKCWVYKVKGDRLVEP
jgi:hypothetical protein